MNKKYKKFALIFCFALALCTVPVQKTLNAADSRDTTEDNFQQAGIDGIVTCKVLETMDAAGYTYFKADTGKHQGWVAVPRTRIKAGEKVSFYEGMKMVNFFSKTLKQTFDTIIFSPGLVGQVPREVVDAVNSTPVTGKETIKENNAKEPDGLENRLPDTQHMPQQIDPMAGSGGSTAAMTTQEEIKLPRADGDNALTVGEIYAKRKTQNGKTVRLRGKVVKYSPNIMGRNWLHIQDGSGNVLENSHDLVVTTTEVPSNLEDITVEGTVLVDKDFGSGYSYSVIIEEATIIK